MIVIDGEVFDVPIISLDETCDFLDKYAERTEDGKLRRELIGLYFNQQIQFGVPDDYNELTRLWDKLTEPVEFHEVTVPDVDGTPFTFTAYFAGVKRSLHKDKTNYTRWRDVAVNFIAQEPAA